jgi:predicted nucleic acid-binding Zn ribbon protein
MQKMCVICDKPFETLFGHQKACSKECSAENNIRKRNENYVKNRDHRIELDRQRYAKVRTPTILSCIVCGNPFERRNGIHLTCSEGCSDKNKKQYMRQYRFDNLEEITERLRQYHADNREALNARSRQRRDENYEARVEGDRQYRLKNLDIIAERKHKDYVKNTAALVVYRELVGREPGDRRKMTLIRKLLEELDDE